MLGKPARMRERPLDKTNPNECPKCQKRVYVSHTLHPCSNKTVRYHRCANCDFRIKSVQQYVPVYVKKNKSNTKKIASR